MNLFVLKSWLQARAGLTKDQIGANLVEYIVLIALIVLIVIIAIKLLQPVISDKFSDACEELDSAATCR